MTKTPTSPTLGGINALFSLGRLGALTDGQLLERFTAGDGGPDELAFVALVERHGPMVFGVCKAVLGDEEAARDAFQATFLILLRKSNSLWVQDSIGPWLHRVAHRAAQNARSATIRRRFHEQRAAEMRAAHTTLSDVCDDVAKTLHEEIASLPMRYRIPLVLCHLEGRTHEEASRYLRCPIGTIKSRLARGRERLRSRMVRRGIELSACAIAAHSAETARAAIPEALVRGTLEIVKEVATGRLADGTVSTANLLARRVHQTMFQKQLAMTAAFATAIVSLAFGAGAVIQQDEGASTRSNAVPRRTITIHVVDRDGRPLRDAHVFTNYSYNFQGNERSLLENQDGRTDAKGTVEVALQGTSVDLRIWASCKGFCPQYAMWAKQFQSDGDQIPKEFTFKLEPGTVIGGIIVDEAGRPIAGAKVEVRDGSSIGLHQSRAGKRTPGKRPVRAYFLTEDKNAIFTDAQGRWRLDNVPADKDLVFESFRPAPVAFYNGPADRNLVFESFRPAPVKRYNAPADKGPVLKPVSPALIYPPAAQEIELQVSHPGYNAVEWGDPQIARGATLKSLRDQTAKVVLVKK